MYLQKRCISRRNGEEIQRERGKEKYEFIQWVSGCCRLCRCVYILNIMANALSLTLFTELDFTTKASFHGINSFDISFSFHRSYFQSFFHYIFFTSNRNGFCRSVYVSVFSLHLSNLPMFMFVTRWCRECTLFLHRLSLIKNYVENLVQKKKREKKSSASRFKA